MLNPIDSLFDESDYVPNGEITFGLGYANGEDIKPSCSSSFNGHPPTVDQASNLNGHRQAVDQENGVGVEEIPLSSKTRSGQKRRRSQAANSNQPDLGALDPTAIDANFNEEWNIFEKRRLLQSLEEQGPDDIGVLQAAVGTKSKNQVVTYMTSLMETIPLTVKIGGDHPFCETDSYSSGNSQFMKNIESWLSIAKAHMGDRSDFSYVLGDVFTQIAQQHQAAGEERIVTVSEKKFAFNYSRVYSYLGSILRGCRQAPILNPLECFVLLDMLKELAEEVKNLPEEAERSAFLSQLMHSHAEKTISPAAPQMATLNSKAAGGAVSIDLTSLNPLCIPVKLLRVVPKKPMTTS